MGAWASGLVLKAITPENVREVCDLRVAPDQEQFVASVAVSLAEAYVQPAAWCRALHADGLVGFVMVHDSPDGPGWWLWRLLVDERFQGRGHGSAAVAQVVEHVRARGASELKVGARRGPGSPRAFYEGLGFTAIGEVLDGEEDVLVLDLSAGQLPKSAASTQASKP